MRPQSFITLGALCCLTALLSSGCFFVRDDGCDAVVTDCVDICDTYCDPWGCWTECYTDCRDTCVIYPAPPPSTVVVVDSRECVRDSDCPRDAYCNSQSVCVFESGSPQAGLCESCLGHSDCRESGALCLDFGEGATSGHCGRSCAQDRDCPADYQCLPAGSSNQCVPTGRTCDGRTPV